MILASSAEGLMLVALPPFLLGLALLKLGAWPRRRGETPHCRSCDYNLTGLTSPQCPECGAQLTPETTVYGERRLRSPVIFVGALCLVIALGWAVNQGRHVNWYRHAPTFWVIRDLRSSDITIVRKASAEMRRREARLSESQRSDLIEWGLQEQKAAKPQPAEPYLVEFLARCSRKGLLSPTQKDTFWQQMVSISDLIVPAEVVSGDELTYQFKYLLRGPSRGSTEYMRIFIEHGLIRIDDAIVPSKHSSWSTAFNDGDARGITSGPPVVVHEKAGSHRFLVRPTVVVYPADDHALKGKPCYEREVKLEATFRVVEPRPSP